MVVCARTLVCVCVWGSKNMCIHNYIATCISISRIAWCMLMNECLKRCLYSSMTRIVSNIELHFFANRAPVLYAQTWG